MAEKELEREGSESVTADSPRLTQVEMLECLLDLINGDEPRVPGLGGLTTQSLDMAEAVIERMVDTGQKPNWGWLFSILEGVKADRLRRCLRCERYFYARRGNKRVCSKACGDVLRQRLKRARAAQYQAAQNKKRKKTRREIKAGA